MKNKPDSASDSLTVSLTVASPPSHNRTKAKDAAACISAQLANRPILVIPESELCAHFAFGEKLPKKFKARLAELKIQMLKTEGHQVILYREDCSMNHLPIYSYL